MATMGIKHLRRKIYLNGSVILLVSIILNFQEITLSKKLCFEENNSGNLKTCSLFNYKCDHHEEKCNLNEETRSKCQNQGSCSKFKEKPKVFSFFNDSSHHLDILLLGNWFTRDLRPLTYKLYLIALYQSCCENNHYFFNHTKNSTTHYSERSPPGFHFDCANEILLC